MKAMVSRLFHYDDKVVAFIEEVRKSEREGCIFFAGNDRVRVSKHSLCWKWGLRKRLLAWRGHPIDAQKERTLQHCVCIAAES